MSIILPFSTMSINIAQKKLLSTTPDVLGFPVLMLSVDNIDHNSTLVSKERVDMLQIRS